MRKLILLITCFILIFICLCSADTFDNLKTSYFTLCVIDYGQTNIFLQKGTARELNLFARQFMDKPMLSAPIIMGLMVIEDWSLNLLKRHNKTVAYIVLGILIIAKTYFVCNNWQYVR